MSSRLFNGTTDVVFGAAVATAVPATLSAWVNTAALGAIGAVISLCASGSATLNFMQLSVNSTGFPQATHNGTATSNTAVASAALTTGTWHHICAIFSTVSLRSCFLDGGHRVQDTGANNAPVGIDRTSIGGRNTTALATPFSGLIAQPAVWNDILSNDLVLALANGCHPRKIMPNKRVLWVPNTQVPGFKDWVGLAGVFTVTGTTVAAGEPPFVRHH